MTRFKRKKYSTADIASIHRQNGGVGQLPDSMLYNGTKRKADSIIDTARPHRRPRIEDSGDYLSEANIRSRMPMPTTGQYPTAPKGLFDWNMIHQVNRLTQTAGVNIGKDFQNRNKRTRCILHAKMGPGHTMTAAGDGHNKVHEYANLNLSLLTSEQKDAMKAAYLHYLSNLHQENLLNDLLPSPMIDAQIMKDEADAKIEVYNYAARLGVVPQYTCRKILRPIRAKGRTQFEVTIKLQEQNIEVAARGLFLEDAETAASIKFKEAAERHHSEHGEGSITIKDSASLNTGNMKHFFEFYKMNNKSISFDLDAGVDRGYKTRGSGAWTMQVVKKAKNDNAAIAALLGEPTKASSTPIGEPVTMTSKKMAEEAAYLVAAVHLSKESPNLMNDFRRALSQAGSNGILVPMRPVDMKVDSDALLIMQDTLLDSRRAGLPDEKESIISDEGTEKRSSMRRTQLQRPFAHHEAQKRSQILAMRHKALKDDSKFEDLRNKKASLPMNQYRAEVFKMVNDHTYSVIVGATGSGKTTQVPQILLEEAITQGQGASCNVICTQPRRIAATSIARRVAEERGENLQDTVGYHVRFDPKRPQTGGSINYCTTGILLQQLQAFPDEILDQTSHIVIDEVHERDIQIDFLMIVVKQVLAARKRANKSVPKVILMSATIDSDLFARYFQETKSKSEPVPCPSLSVPGRTFPVTEKYLPTILKDIEQAHGSQALRSLSFDSRDKDTKEYLDLENSFRAANPSKLDGSERPEATIDWKREASKSSDGQSSSESEDALVPISLVATSIAHVCKTSSDGAILVFLPGYDEMKKVGDTIRSLSPLGIDFRNDSKSRIFMLHSSVPAAEQQEVFKGVPPGCRKIILSTNIAETSVTIPDVQYVIDTGKLREKRYDQVRRITKLQCTWISKSNAKQRAGRAGRVQNGHYLALYSRDRFESLRAIGLPEMLRSDLQEVCLDIKAQAFQTPIRPFLAQAIEAPSPAAVDSSVMNLQRLEALTDDEKLTPLGRLLASLPVHPSLGKMIVLGIVFRCLDPMIILGAALSERSLFMSPPEKRRAAEERHALFVEDTASDHFALINAFTQMRLLRHRRDNHALQSFAFENFLHVGAFQAIDGTSKQIEEILFEAGLIPRVRDNERFECEYGHPSLNKNATNVSLIKSLALAGLHPNLGACTGGPLFRTPGEKNAMIASGSMNAVRGKQPNPPVGTLYSYSTMAKSNDGKSIFLRGTSASTPLMAVLFGGRLRVEGRVLEMDGWLPFYLKLKSNEIKVLVEFRKALDRMLTGAFGDLAASRANRVSDPRPRRSNEFESGNEDLTSPTYLADDQIREIFSEGLVDVLKRDVFLEPRQQQQMDSYRPGTLDRY